MSFIVWNHRTNEYLSAWPSDVPARWSPFKHFALPVDPTEVHARVESWPFLLDCTILPRTGPETPVVLTRAGAGPTLHLAEWPTAENGTEWTPHRAHAKRTTVREWRARTAEYPFLSRLAMAECDEPPAQADSAAVALEACRASAQERIALEALLATARRDAVAVLVALTAATKLVDRPHLTAARDLADALGYVLRGTAD